MSRQRNSSPVSLFSFQDIITTVVGVMLLIILILLLQLVSQMFAAPPVPTMTEEEIKQQIEEIKPVLTELQDSIVELRHARDQSEVQTPSQEQIDAVRSTIDTLETDVAETEKKIEVIKKRIEDLQNNPAMPQLEKMEQDVEKLISELARQPKSIAVLQTEIRNLNTENTAQDQHVASRVKVIIRKDTNKTAYIVDYKSVSGRDTITVHREDGSLAQTLSTQQGFFEWVDGQRNHNTDHFVVYVRPSRFSQYSRMIEVLRSMKFDVGLQVIGESTDLFF